MTKINLEDIALICEHINNQDRLSLDPESDYYNQELAEAVEDIITTVSVSMVSEGCSASGVVDFLANASEQEILEYYLNCTFSEGIVSEEYIQEQIEILNEGIPLGLIGKAAMAGLKNAGRVANIAVKRAAGPGARKAIAGAVTRVKDIAKGAKAALPTIAKGAAVLGLGAAGGAIGAKMAGAGSGSQNAKTEPSGGAVKDLAAYKAGGGGAKSKASGMGTADVEKLGRTNLFKAGGGEAKMKKTGMTQQQVMDLGSKNVAAKTKANTKTTPAPEPSSTPSQSSTPSTSPTKPKTPTTPAKPKGSAMDQWAAANPTLAAAKAERDRTRGTSATTNPLMKDLKADLPAPKSPASSTAKTAFDLSKKGVDLSKKTQTVSSSYEYDAYDLVLEYLLETGQVDTINEAHYIMMELDVETIGSIVEAKYGTAAGRKALAKKVRAGEDVGKEGGGFEKIVTKASKKYGKKRATKIAAAAMWKNLAKEE